jgi:hypothetical protein
VSARAIVCTNCGAGLEPKVLETKVKCTYCETVFAIVRDQDGVSGLADESQAPGHHPGPAPGSTPWSAPANQPGTIAGLDAQTVERLERDALLVVRGLEAAEQVVGGRGLARRGCLGAVLLVLSLAGAVLAAIA